jgi:DNA-binding XRE family transcriptional regulator
MYRVDGVGMPPPPAAVPSVTAAADRRVGPVDVEALRRELMVSQVELAKLLHVSKRTVLRWEAGAPQTGAAALLLRALRSAVDAAPRDWRLPVVKVDGRPLTSRVWVGLAPKKPLQVWSRLFELAAVLEG